MALLFCRTFQEADVTLSVGFCPGDIGLPEGIDVGVFEVAWKGRPASTFVAGHLFFRLSWEGFLGGLRHLTILRRIWGDPKKDLWIVGGINGGVAY